MSIENPDRAEMAIKKSRYNALLTGTGPLRYPRRQYVTVKQAAKIKVVAPERIKRAIFDWHLPAEVRDPPQLLILKSDLEKTVIRGRYHNGRWTTKPEKRRQEYLSGERVQRRWTLEEAARKQAG
jgi:hypothetical protein